MKYLILLMVFIFISCTQKVENPKFSGDHFTESIRGMWHVCYMTHRKVNRSAPEEYLWKLCDCVIDKSRAKYKATDYEKVDQVDLTDFFSNANSECALEIKEGGRFDTQKIPQMRAL